MAKTDDTLVRLRTANRTQKNVWMGGEQLGKLNRAPDPATGTLTWTGYVQIPGRERMRFQGESLHQLREEMQRLVSEASLG